MVAYLIGKAPRVENFDLIAPVEKVPGHLQPATGTEAHDQLRLLLEQPERALGVGGQREGRIADKPLVQDLDTLAQTFSEIAADVVADAGAGDNVARRTYRSYTDFCSLARGWTELVEGAYLPIRRLG